MALRATSDIAFDRTSARVGDVLTVRVKVENTGSVEESVALAADGLPDGVLMAFEPASAAVPKKGRKALVFAWRAALPADKDALTIRGRLVLRNAVTGQEAGAAQLDVYVSR